MGGSRWRWFGWGIASALAACSFGETDGDNSASLSPGESGGFDSPQPTATGTTSIPGGNQSAPGGGSAGSSGISTPRGLTPNGDGTFRDARGTIVSFNERGQLVDQRGRVVTVGADGIVVPVDPEREVESSFRVPVVTGNLIWAANPESGRVALVDASTHAVTTLPAGLQPTYLAAIEGLGPNRAIVINTLGSDATLFRNAAAGGFSSVDIRIHEGANAWAVSPRGRWAVAWSDASQVQAPDDTEGFQDVSLIDLALDPPTATRFAVGYRPLKLTVNADETRVYAVTQSGISVIELAQGPRLLDDVRILSSEEELAADIGKPVLDDVPISADGRFALVRFSGARKLKVLDLSGARSQLLELPGEVSDVDIAGESRRAVAVIRNTSQVALFDLEAVFAEPSAFTLATFTGETIGSTALPDTGNAALLFTNAIDSDRLSILDTSAAAGTGQRVVSLKAPINAVFPAPDGSHAIALLTPERGSERPGAFSVIPVASALPPKIQGTDAPPFRVSLANTSAGLRGLVTVRDDATQTFAVYLVRMPSLQVDRIELSSPPIAVGILPDLGTGFVAQQHPEGRITFIDLESAEPQTLTGFELATRVVSGGAP